ncbi:phage major capsid protein [Delftia tsuruhatensis]|uniref:Phage capsid protein n=2 Tax=Delftia tsuruhatensis TaxID=180282 RepID=A0ABN4SK47_9BURK|nr:phage major capsid protein [Delftia tsuruhatensis]AOV01693.1 phage capsid protein [Delftia tsuruhatensis]AOV02399.1 phage capsid protein [Delftia tsuruhatensis]
MDPKAINRVYSTMVVKAIDEDKREITGIASTPGTDRMGDIVEPGGAEFTLPIPLLWQHDHLQPIGSVFAARITREGIEIRASVVKPTPDMPSQLIARLEEAWSSIKAKLVRGLSIGFSPIEWALMDSGIRFTRWNWHELSAVTVPANAEASITSIKSLDTVLRASSGSKAQSGVGPAEKSAPPPGVSGTPKQLASGGFFYAPKKGKDTMNVSEQIKALEDKRKALTEERTTIQTKAVDEGRTKDGAEQERFAEITAEVAAIDKELGDLKVMEKDLIASAKPVKGQNDAEAAASRGTVPVSVKNTHKLDKGIAFARAAKCLALGHLEHRDAIQIAKSLFGENESIVLATQQLVTKAAVPAATTTNQPWAGALVGEETSVFADFVEYLRPQTILGRFGQAGIPGLRRVPFRVPLIGQTTGGAGYWVGEGQAKPLTQFDFNRTTLEPLKVANIAVATMEVIRDSSPSADVIIRDQLAAALRERLDIDFIDPAKAAVAGVSPASILNGVAGIVSSGTDADAVRGDIKALFSAFIAANNAPTSGVWVMPATTALALSLMQNPLGQSEFPGISMTGGTLFGLPVIVSEYVPTDSSGAIVALVNASDIYLGDEGGIDLSMSTEASLQMDNAPDNPTTASTVMVSLWQRNLVGFRAERAINWARRRPTAVAYLTGVNWGAGA